MNICRIKIRSIYYMAYIKLFIFHSFYKMSYYHWNIIKACLTLNLSTYHLRKLYFFTPIHMWIFRWIKNFGCLLQCNGKSRLVCSEQHYPNFYKNNPNPNKGLFLVAKLIKIEVQCLVYRFVLHMSIYSVLILSVGLSLRLQKAEM